MRMRGIGLLLIMLSLLSCTKSITVTEEAPIDKRFHQQKVGTSARDFLTDEKFTSLKIEVQYMTGYEPDEKALLNLKAFLHEHLHKPDGISIITKEISPSKDSLLTMKELMELEKIHRTEYSSGKELALYLLYTNGYYIEEKMLGYAYLNTSAVLFGRNLDDNSNKFKKLNRTDLETKVLQHELGHLLGLVNVGSPLQSEHKDNDHGKHCINKKCLMYYLTDTETPSILLRKQPPVLDKECLEDLRANGAKTY